MDVKAWRQTQRVWWKPWTWRKRWQEVPVSGDPTTGMITFETVGKKGEVTIVDYETNFVAID